MTRILTAVAASALVIVPLSSCGDDSDAAASGSYCGDLGAAGEQVDALQSGDLGGLEETTETLHDLAGTAPGELADAWETLIEGMDRLVAALRATGFTDEDMANLQSGQVPDGVDMGALQDLMAEIQGLDTTEFQRAIERISAHAEEDCGIDLRA